MSQIDTASQQCIPSGVNVGSKNLKEKQGDGYCKCQKEERHKRQERGKHLG